MNEPTKIQTAAQGHGPLWQRDYWVEIQNSRCSPEELIKIVRREFPEFSPVELAEFQFKQPAPLQPGNEMPVTIRGVGSSAVRCVHLEPRSFTLRTMEGHPEAGRITFGAYCQGQNLIFRVRSRARSIDRVRGMGFKLGGHMMQAKTWLIFVERVAKRSGGEIVGEAQTSSQEVKSTLADLGELDTPTFIAKDKPLKTDH